MAVVSQDVAVAYRVEVSGWDDAQEFFVEKTDLHWSEGTGEHVLLSRVVSPGALLFLRLLHPTSLDRVHPIPYQADPEASGETPSGPYLVRLLQAHPRTRER